MSKLRKKVDNRTVKPINLRVSAETRQLLEAILERDGVPFNAQVERAMKMWAQHKGIKGGRGIAMPGGAGGDE